MCEKERARKKAGERERERKRAQEREREGGRERKQGRKKEGESWEERRREPGGRDAGLESCLTSHIPTHYKDTHTYAHINIDVGIDIKTLRHSAITSSH